jgi:selenocysteine-specific elongation factor
MATPSTPEITPLTVGTAGHIDHGKTRLVERLTGMRADRPYERERGMTIDIGYAEMQAEGGLRVGFVDLPGHERFIRNMVAGATGIDVALLVVAADDGVMPQTLEHMEILGLLGIRRGLAVLNKVDIVDEEMRELALEELREFLAETSLAGADVLCCSAETGEGIEELRAALLGLVAEAARHSDPGCFFLGAQRSFAAQGFGCIVTGVPSSGSVAVGDELELLPAGKKARVRAIEIYHAAAERARAGHRTALNLAGIAHHEVERGMAVAAPGVFEPGRHVAARLEILPGARRAVKHAGGVRFLTGTLEEMAQVYLLEGDALKPGERALVEIRTKHGIVVRDGDPFILRTDNAKETLGGGRIVRGLDRPIGRRNTRAHERLRRWDAALDDPAERLRAAIEIEGPAAAAALARYCRLDREATQALLDTMRAEGELVVLPNGAFAPAADVERGADALHEALVAMHREHPLLAALPVADVRDRAGLSEALLQVALAQLGERVVLEARALRLADHAVQLDPATERAAGAVRETLDGAGYAPPARDKLAETAGLSAGELKTALTFLSDQGRVPAEAQGDRGEARNLRAGRRQGRPGRDQPQVAHPIAGVLRQAGCHETRRKRAADYAAR